MQRAGIRTESRDRTRTSGSDLCWQTSGSSLSAPSVWWISGPGVPTGHELRRLRNVASDEIDREEIGNRPRKVHLPVTISQRLLPAWRMQTCIGGVHRVRARRRSPGCSPSTTTVFTRWRDATARRQHPDPSDRSAPSPFRHGSRTRSRCLLTQHHLRRVDARIELELRVGQPLSQLHSSGLDGEGHARLPRTDPPIIAASWRRRRSNRNQLAPRVCIAADDGMRPAGSGAAARPHVDLQQHDSLPPNLCGNLVIAHSCPGGAGFHRSRFDGIIRGIRRTISTGAPLGRCRGVGGTTGRSVNASEHVALHLHCTLGQAVARTPSWVFAPITTSPGLPGALQRR